jgi:hypothetical protein
MIAQPGTEPGGGLVVGHVGVKDQARRHQVWNQHLGHAPLPGFPLRGGIRALLRHGRDCGFIQVRPGSHGPAAPFSCLPQRYDRRPSHGQVEDAGVHGQHGQFLLAVKQPEQHRVAWISKVGVAEQRPPGTPCPDRTVGTSFLHLGVADAGVARHELVSQLVAENPSSRVNAGSRVRR